MLKQLTATLALSVKVIVEAAINYLHFYVRDRGISVHQLANYPQTLGSHSFKLILGAETSHKLEELGMAKQPNECAVLGIQLLYENLVGHNQKVSTHE
ncbi:MAG: hypothetical protein VKJ46_16155 [Leptolyngbyaceae bacterium]|nr:hypothetical protein [Leptolyngbyaceae bacterium]